MGDSGFSFLAMFIVMGVVFLVFYLDYRKRYKSLPTFEEYKAENPDNVVDGTIICTKCDGSKIQLRGYRNAGDRRKIHSCVGCGSPLYRSFH